MRAVSCWEARGHHEAGGEHAGPGRAGTPRRRVTPPLPLPTRCSQTGPPKDMSVFSKGLKPRLTLWSPRDGVDVP